MSTSRNKTLLLRNIMHVFLTFMLIMPALYLRAPTVVRGKTVLVGFNQEALERIL